MPGDYEKQGGDDESCGGSCVSTLIFIISMILIICTFPFSLCVCIKMVQVRNQYLDIANIFYLYLYDIMFQEYERAVIFRLGRIKKGAAVGPGLFFIIPCMDQV